MADKIDIMGGSECCYCTELKENRFPLQYRHHYPVKSRLCLETDHFVVWPSIAPLCEGHMLIIPKLHFTCLAGIGEQLGNEFKNVLQQVLKTINDIYGCAFLFEHGVVRISDQACGINHAHLHVLPMAPVDSMVFERSVAKQFPVFADCSLEQIICREKPERAYLLYGSDLLRMRMTLSDRIPSQFLRKTAGETIGNRDWDWRNFSGRAPFLATIKAFSLARCDTRTMRVAP